MNNELNNKTITVFITYPNIESAKTSAKLAIEKKLAACANIHPQVQSIYYWEGKVQEDNEVSVYFKTTTNQWENLKNFIKETHPYECPCIIAYDHINGNDEYLKWISDSCSHSE